MAMVHEQCWEGTTTLRQVRKCIRNGHHVVVIMRGVPGSGKSHLASELVMGTDGIILSTDRYFIQNGSYQFDSEKLSEYHLKNWREATDAMQKGIKPIIIDNTNIYVAHMMPYITQAVKNIYEIYFVEPETEWKKNAQQCARRNTHSVPEEKIAHMIECFEKVDLSNAIKPKQLRINPPLLDLSDEENDALTGSLIGKSSASASGSRHYLSLEWPKGVQQDHSDNGEPRKVVPLSSTDKQFGLSEVLNSVKTTPCNSLPKNDVANEDKPCEPLFSLAPPKLNEKSVRSVGCQTSDLIRLFEMADSLPSVSDEFFWEAVIHDIPVSDKKKMKTKAVQAGNGDIPSDIDVLVALFPDEKPSDLSHILEIAGLNHGITLLKEMNARMNIFAKVCKNKGDNGWGKLSETYKRSKQWNDKVAESNSLVAQPKSEINAMMTEKLAPCTYMQSFDREPVREGYCRMELSVDMMKQLTQLFGNNGKSSVTKTYVDLPIWHWRRIYQHWQGLSITDDKMADGFVCEDFDDVFPSTSPDEDLARILQNAELASASSGCGKHLSTAGRLQLSALINDYRGIDPERIVECFRDNNFSAEATRNTLQVFVSEAENPRAIMPPLNQFDNYGASPRPSSSHFTSDGYLDRKPDLDSIQKKVSTLREEAEKYSKRKDEMLARASTQREFGAKTFYVTEGQRFGKKAKDCLAKLNEVLAEANTSNSWIDLHYMDVQSAIKLLRAKLNAADRPPELRRGRSGKKIIVITGYGKSNDGQAKIRPAVIQWLEQCGYEYCNTQNKGQIIVECK